MDAVYLKLTYLKPSLVPARGIIGNAAPSHRILAARAAFPLMDVRGTRRALVWRQPSHSMPDCQKSPSHDLAAAFRAPAAGALVGLVAQHVVQGRVVFPGAAHIELLRAACCAGADAPDDGARLRGVVFVLPLALDGEGGATRLHELEYVLDHSSSAFEVRSGEAAAGAAGALAHCTGAARPAAAALAWEAGAGAARRGGCERAVSARAQYDGFDAAGLEYGPVYRALERAHAAGDDAAGGATGGARRGAAARLRSTARPRGVAVHPAELDGALQLGGALAPVGPAADGATATRLPFGVDESLVRRGADEAWAVRGGGPGMRGRASSLLWVLRGHEGQGSLACAVLWCDAATSSCGACMRRAWKRSRPRRRACGSRARSARWAHGWTASRAGRWVVRSQKPARATCMRASGGG